MRFIPPTKFCCFPALTYWEIDGKPVSSREAEYGAHPRAVLKETEISKHYSDYIGKLVPDDDEE